jgi:hypothetical protein
MYLFILFNILIAFSDSFSADELGMGTIFGALSGTFNWLKRCENASNFAFNGSSKHKISANARSLCAIVCLCVFCIGILAPLRVVVCE